MTKPVTKVIGAIKCPFCLSEAQVRQTPGKSFKFIFCETSCRRIQTSVPGQAKAYQDYIEDNMHEIIEQEKPLPDFNNVTGESTAIIPPIKPEHIHETADVALVDDEPFWPFDD